MAQGALAYRLQRRTRDERIFLSEPNTLYSGPKIAKIRPKTDQISLKFDLFPDQTDDKPELLVIRQLNNNFIYQTETEAATAQLVSC